MTKAARILNEYHIKELMLKGNPQYENFYKEELIEFCKISKHEIDRLNNIINELEKFCWELKASGCREGALSVLDKLEELKDSDNNVKKINTNNN